VWFGPYLDVDERNSVFRIPADAPQTRYGWRVKFLWIVDARRAAPVTLQGGEVSGQRTLWIEAEGAAAGATVVLDPRRPEAGSGPSGLKEFPSYVYIPAAGCYFLRAAWPRGSWRIVFAAGR
jgi:hypothetical protein